MRNVLKWELQLSYKNTITDTSKRKRMNLLTVHYCNNPSLFRVADTFRDCRFRADSFRCVTLLPRPPAGMRCGVSWSLTNDVGDTEWIMYGCVCFSFLFPALFGTEAVWRQRFSSMPSFRIESHLRQRNNFFKQCYLNTACEGNYSFLICNNFVLVPFIFIWG